MGSNNLGLYSGINCICTKKKKVLDNNGGPYNIITKE